MVIGQPCLPLSGGLDFHTVGFLDWHSVISHQENIKFCSPLRVRRQSAAPTARIQRPSWDLGPSSICKWSKWQETRSLLKRYLSFFWVGVSSGTSTPILRTIVRNEVLSFPVRALPFSLLLYSEGCELFTAIQPGYSHDMFRLVFLHRNVNIVWN